MRTVPTALAQRLAGETTTLAHVWRFTRWDGRIIAFTDHDAPFAFDGLPVEPADGLTLGAVEKGFDLAPDTAGVEGAFSSDAIDAEDLARGLWDDARVDLFLVDWTAPELRVHLFAGRLGEVRRNGGAFAAELRGLKDALDAPAGRVFSRRCDAELGDLRCGVDAAQPAYRGQGAVSAVVDSHTVRASGLAAFAPGWFDRGRLVFDAGGAAEVQAHRLEAGEAVLELIDPPAEALAPGATFVVTAGCDKRHATCRDKFANALNFRGFPHMLGPDALLQAAPAGARGGSRGEVAG